MISQTFPLDENCWIETFTGHKFEPLNPRAEALCLVDIAHALSMKARFTGHCLEFYSVAQHSIAVSNYCENPHLGLMHDAAEAYLPDIARPLKPYYPFHISSERAIMRVILQWCGLIHAGGNFMEWNLPADIKTADLRMLATERRDVMQSSYAWPALEGVEPYAREIRCSSWQVAKKHFIARFNELFEPATDRLGYRPYI